jgi:hypothetical protein
MSRRPRLDDAALRSALSPAHDLVAPAGLLDAIAADIRRTPQHRPVFGWLGLPEFVAPVMGASPRRIAKILAIVALLAALIGGALVGAQLLRPPVPAPLGRSPVEVLAPESGVVERVVVDSSGALWATAPGRLTRFGADGGGRRTWTVADDPAFGDGVVAAAGAGGVWIWSGAEIRRFTGDGFAQRIAAPSSEPRSLLEASDGDLWASVGLGLRRWDGWTWAPLPAGGPTGELGAFLVRDNSDVWVGGSFGLGHLVDGSWATYSGVDLPGSTGEVGSIVEAADGAIWVTIDRAAPTIARFEAGVWATVAGPGFPAWWLEAADDGSVWALTGHDPPIDVARFASGGWTTYEVADGLAGTVAGVVSATSAGVFLGTDAGLLRFADPGWVAAWPEAIAGPGRMTAVVAIGPEEAWAADGRGIWHYVDGAWQGLGHPWAAAEPVIAALALGPDGTLWVTGDEGTAAVRDGRWSIVSERPGQSIAVGPDGTAWIGGRVPGLMRAQLIGAHADVRLVECPVVPSLLSVTRDGSVYVGGSGLAPSPAGLVRFDGQTCDVVEPLGAGRTLLVTGLSADASGGLVAYLTDVGAVPRSGYLARLDDHRWTVHPAPADDRSGLVTVAPSASMWRTSPGLTGGFDRLDGERWIRIVSGVAVEGPVSFGPDGTIWFAGPSGVSRIKADDLSTH